MEVKNLMVEDGFIEELITEFNENNINFLLIPYPSYQEIHFEYNSKGHIYRFFSFDAKVSIVDMNVEAINGKIKKEKPGYKRLNKKMIKQQTRKANSFGY